MVVINLVLLVITGHCVLVVGCGTGTHGPQRVKKRFWVVFFPIVSFLGATLQRKKGCFSKEALVIPCNILAGIIDCSKISLEMLD